MNAQRKQFALSILSYAVQRGIDAEDLCRAAGISLELLKSKEDVEVHPSTIVKVWRNAQHLCRDPLFGLHFGESLQLAALGAVGEIIKSSETVGQGLTLAATFIPIVTDLFNMEVKKGEETFQVLLIETDQNNNNGLVQQIADFLLVFTIHELNGLLLKKVTPIAMQYTYKIDDEAEYTRVFRCKPELTSGTLSMEFDSKLWDEPILTANYDVQKIFLEKVSASVRDPSENISFQVSVMDYLMKNSYLGILSLEDVAANFSITPRSLQRRLQEESVTFQQLADSVRKSLALSYLESGKYQIKEVSYMLGYNELSAFSRAFKRWTGKAPFEYRS
jgi:AraC-like DNA-binding protein